MTTLKTLFKSRKFVTAFGAIISIVLAQLGLDEVAAKALTIAITMLATAYIVGTAAEDMAAKSNTDKNWRTPTNP